MGLALLPTALLVLPALLLWPTLAQDSEEPNVRCGGECWGWGVGCLSSRLLGYTACPYSVGDRLLDRFLSPSLLCLGYSGEAGGSCYVAAGAVLECIACCLLFWHSSCPDVASV